MSPVPSTSRLWSPEHQIPSINRPLLHFNVLCIAIFRTARWLRGPLIHQFDENQRNKSEIITLIHVQNIQCLTCYRCSAWACVFGLSAITGSLNQQRPVLWAIKSMENWATKMKLMTAEKALTDWFIGMNNATQWSIDQFAWMLHTLSLSLGRSKIKMHENIYGARMW